VSAAHLGCSPEGSPPRDPVKHLLPRLVPLLPSSERRTHRLLLLLLLLSLRRGQPSGDEEVVLEQMWQFALNDPAVAMDFLPDGSGRVITAHKTGRLRLYDSVDATVADFKVSADVHCMTTYSPCLQHVAVCA
jgi:hypothetical protein